jgi:predicted outer membrane repeat protein
MTSVTLRAGLRTLVLVALVSSLSPTSGVDARQTGAARGPSAPSSPYAQQWLNGPLVGTSVINCASVIFGSPYAEQGLGAFVSQLVDPALSQPQPNQTYYLRVYIAATGNPCPVQITSVEFELPPNTAYDFGNAPFCFHNQGAGTGSTSTCGMIENTSAGRLWVRSTDPSGFWVFRQGYTLDIQIPVKSSAPFTAQPAGVRIQVADGNSSPTLNPFVNAYVFPGTGSGGSSGGGTGGSPSSNPPTFAFDAPSTISVTQNGATAQGYLYTPALAGNLFFDYGTVPGSYANTVGPSSLAAGSWFNTVNMNGFVSPGTTYYWRFRFVGANSVTYSSSEQSFTTPISGDSVVGTGTPGSCTAQGVLDALQASANITVTFNCGAVPVTIPVGQLSYPGSVTQPGIVVDTGRKVIDGGNKVSFESSARSVFGLEAGELVLKNMVISGVVPSRGGYAVFASGGVLTLEGVRVFNNRTEAGDTGAVLVKDATATITGSAFISNSAPLHGGALYVVRSTVFINDSDFSRNSAGGNGGAIALLSGDGGSQPDSVLQINRSLFYSNTAGGAGGAIYMPSTSAGNQVSFSTLDSNRATGFAGAISGRGSLNNLTISANSSGVTDCEPGVYCVSGAVDFFDVLSLSDSILSGNTPGNCGVDQSASPPYVLSTFRGNLSSDASCTNYLTHATDLHSTNPQLGPLAGNNGRTRTRSITVGSPAYNSSQIGSTSDRDQRGFTAFGTGDRGAFELQSSEIPIIVIGGTATPTPTPEVPPTPVPGTGTPLFVPTAVPTATGTPMPGATATSTPIGGPGFRKLYVPVIRR